MNVWGLLIIVAQGVIIGLLCYFVRVFGSYTDTLEKAHHDAQVMLRIIAARENRRNGGPPKDYVEDQEEVA